MEITSQQRAFIIGTILGDGGLEFVTSQRNVRLQIAHSTKQKMYVQWKFKILKSLVNTGPKLVTFYDYRYNKYYSRFRFYTLTHLELFKLRKFFYPRNRKIIPEAIGKILKDPLSLAIWYMDDGKRRPDCRGIYLDNICFKKYEQQRLINCLKDNFGIVGCRLHWNGDGYHIYIPYPMSLHF